jgi:hypothetical protein
MGKDKNLQKDTCIIDDSLHVSAGPAEPETPFIKRILPQWVGKAFQGIVLKGDKYTMRRYMPRRQPERSK